MPRRIRLVPSFGVPGSTRRFTSAALADLVAIFVFVTLGRREHESGADLAGLLRIAAPFAIAAIVAAFAVRALRRDPISIRSALIIWPVTLIGGMVLRRTVFDRGTATAFVIVATVFLGLAMFGWRFAATRLRVAERPPALGTVEPMPESSDASAVTMYWRPGCPFCASLEHKLEKAGIGYTKRNIWDEPDAAAFVRSVARGNETVPTLVVGDRAMVNPSISEVQAALVG